MSRNRIGIRWAAALALIGMIGTAQAECGGQQQCMAVSIDPAVAPAHGTPETSAPLIFGSVPSGSASASRPVLVGAVTGPQGSLATLNSITIVGSNPGDFEITSQTCVVGTPSLLADGPTCTVNVAFRPSTIGTRSAELKVSTSAITRTIPLSGTGTAPLPTATPTSLTVKAGTPTALDLSNNISGPSGETLTIEVSSAPLKGTAVVSDKRIIYTPTGTYLGSDSFSYVVKGSSGGTSAPATVSVSVVARASPAADAAVTGVLRAQSQTAQRFAAAQSANIQGRLDALRRSPVALGGAAATMRTAQSAAEAPHPDAHSRRLLVASAPADRTTTSDADRYSLLPLSSPLLQTMADAARTGSVRLESVQSMTGSASSTGFWAAGQTQFGSRAARAGLGDLRFSTDGVTLGLDRRFGHRLLLGAAVGYARDRSDVGADGSGARATGSSVSLYGSFQPADRAYVDLVVGAGRLSLDVDRYVQADAVTAKGSRDGNQWFGAVTAGYDFHSGSVVLSPYGRLDGSQTRLDAYDEIGAGLAGLSYLAQKLPRYGVALGLSAQSRHSADIGWFMPRARLEWRHELRREGAASMFYTKLPGNVYQVAASGDRRDSLVLGLGTELQLRSGLRLGADFQTQRLGARDADQTLRVWLAQSLDASPVPAPNSVGEKWFTDPLRVEAFVTTDDNLNRAGDPLEKRSDRSYSLNVSKGTEIRLGQNTRLLASAFGAADKFVRYAGLDRVSLGAQARAEYRASSAFSEPIWGVQARLSYDDLPGVLRTGTQSSLALTYRQSLTDRIEAFASVTRRMRQSESAVFDERDVAALLQLDYTLSPSAVIYAAAERRKGDLVSSVPQAPAYASFARASAAEDAYGAAGLFAYRYEARTTIWTFGLNRPIGPRDAVDISARRVSSTPTAPSSPLYGDPPSYSTTQLSLAYLLRF